MATSPNRASPMAAVLAKTGHIDANTAGLANTSNAINETFTQIADALKTKMHAEAISGLLSPKQSDPAEQLKSTMQTVASFAGLSSAEERREEAKQKDERDRMEREERRRAELEAKEMQIALEREKLEHARQQAAENLQLQVAKMQMEANERMVARMDEQAKMMASMFEKMNAPKQHEPHPLEKFFVEKGFEIMTSQQPGPLDQIKDAQQLLTALGIGGNKGGMNDLEYELKKQELEWKKEEAAKAREVELQKVKNQSSFFEQIPNIIATIQSANSKTPAQDGQAGQTAQPATQYVPVSCEKEGCGHTSYVPYGANPVRCDKCGTVDSVDWGVSA